MNEFSLPLVGIDFPNADRRGTNRRSELMMMPPGTPLTLKPEPGNPYDPHAVAVFSPAGIQVGYLPADRAPYIAVRLRRGEEVRAIFQQLAANGAALRLRLRGGEPTLPAPQLAPLPRDANDDAFQPDGPEWGA